MLTPMLTTPLEAEVEGVGQEGPDEEFPSGGPVGKYEKKLIISVQLI